MLPTFTYPWALLLLLLLPAWIWRYRFKKRGAWTFSDVRLLPATWNGRAPTAWWGGMLLRLAGLTCLILALSGPRWIDEKERIPTDGITIAMVLDVSVSMNERDFALGNETTTRLLGVQKLFRLFVAGGSLPSPPGGEGPGMKGELPGRRNDLIALVTFATHPETACPPTLEHKTLLEIMDAQVPRTAANEGTTNAGDAIAWALHVLKSAPTRRKVIVFLTDGESNVKQVLTPIQAAHLAANLAVPIYTIDAAPEPKNKNEEADIERARDKMQAIAKMTDGRYFRAQDGRGMVKAYESIDKMERDRILSYQYRRYVEGYAWFALAGLACWLIVIFLESTTWRVVP